MGSCGALKKTELALAVLAMIYDTLIIGSICLEGMQKPEFLTISDAIWNACILVIVTVCAIDLALLLVLCRGIDTENVTLMNFWWYWSFIPLLLLLPFALIVVAAVLVLCMPYFVWYSVLTAKKQIDQSSFVAPIDDQHNTTPAPLYPRQASVPPMASPSAPMSTGTLVMCTPVSPGASTTPYNPHMMPYMMPTTPMPYIIHQ